MTQFPSPLDPPDMDFKPISPALIKARLLGHLVFFVALLFGAGALAWLAELPWAGVGLAGAALVYLLWILWLVPRQVRAWGYAETETDLVFRRGIMFRRLTAVPYGRMQFVDLSQGPVDSFFGIASVKLHSAAASTDASIPGLPKAEAQRLRQVLTERGDAQRAGL